jgi:hypothetical protein
MRPLLLSLTLLFLAPGVSSAIELRWSSGSTAITFTSATRCTLTIGTGAAGGALPEHWRLVWVGDNCDLRPVASGSGEACIPDRAVVVTVLEPTSPPEVAANIRTVELCRPATGSAAVAWEVFDLPAGGRGKLKVIALDPTDPDSTRILESNVVTFNGGVTDGFPPAILHIRTHHASTEFQLIAVGTDLSGVDTVALAAEDGSWRESLTPTQVDDRQFTAIGAFAASVPACIVEAGGSGGLAAALVEPDPPPPALEPLGASCQETFHETLLPLPTIQPKDFAFVLGGWTPTGTWLFHLFYTRQNQLINAAQPESSSLNLGHAVSNDLLDWPMAEVDTLSFRIRKGMFDNGHVWAPYIVKRGLTYNMFYTGVDTLGNQAIGLATSTDLVTWTRRPEPVFHAGHLSQWAIPKGPQGTDPAQLRDPFVMPDPDNPGSWLMYFVTIPANHPDGQIVGFARSNGAFTQWSNDAPLYATLHLIDTTSYGDVESPTVFRYQGRWWLFYGVREIRPVWAISHPTSPTDEFASNWTQTIDINNLIIDEFTGDSTGAYFYWHAAEFLQVNADANIAFLAGFNDQSVGISYIPVRLGEAPFLFEEHCPVTTTGVDEEPASASEPSLVVLGPHVVRSEVRLRVELPRAVRARLAVYDVAGRRVRVVAEDDLPAGTSDFVWDGRSTAGLRAASGVYFASLEGAGPRRIARAVLLR